MKLSTLMSYSDSFTDETQTSANALAYANEGIAMINTKCSLKLPFFTSIDEEYDSLPDSWVLRFILNYMNYGVKMNDSSLNEAYEYKNKFDLAIYDFNGMNKSAIVDATLIDNDSKSIFMIDTSNAINVGWFANANDEWTGW